MVKKIIWYTSILICIFLLKISFSSYLLFFKQQYLANFSDFIEKIAFSLWMPVDGINPSPIFSIIINDLIFAICFTSAYIIMDIKFYKLTRLIFSFIIFILISTSIIVFLTLYDFKSLNNSNFFEENYVKSNNVKIKFPSHKKNLILIFLESMENTFSSNFYGGVGKNYIPELSKLSLYNTNFSINKNKLNGFFQTTGTSYSAAGRMSILSGTPIKVPFFKNPFKNNFFKNVTFLGDILNEQGYSQGILLCVNKLFHGAGQMFKQHGNYKINDISNFYNPIDYMSDNVIFMVNDQELLDYGKKEIMRLSTNQPFSFVITTGDTHFRYDLNLDNNKNKNLHPYAKTLKQESKLVADFVSWCQKQDFYKDTLIVLVGDHLTMQTSFVDDLPKDYQRKIYFSMLNSSIPYTLNQDRDFSHFDLFPTILAGLGVKIEGNKLALGVNLFSKEKTLVEKIGIEKLNQELAKNSMMYESFY